MWTFDFDVKKCWKDLKICAIVNLRLNVDIYGIKEKDDKKVDFEIEIVSNIPYDTKYQIDTSLPEGMEKVKQRGANGIIVNAYKLIQQNGVTISKELISKDTYKALDRVILKSSN